MWPVVLGLGACLAAVVALAVAFTCVVFTLLGRPTVPKRGVRT